jgi:thioredoxin reductase (NADPH)
LKAFVTSSIKKYDIVIVGGGPAGMSAALWASDLGLCSVLIEKNGAVGGQLSMIHNPINNYLGLQAANGDEMRLRFLRSLEEAEFDLSLGNEVVRADLGARQIETGGGNVFEGGSIVIATGVRRRKLNVDGEDEFEGKGILSSGAKEAESVRGKNVVVVGGGDAAMENSLVLSEHARSVTLIHRRNKFKARKEFIKRARERGNVTFLTDSVVERFAGNHSLRFVEVRPVDDHTVVRVECDFALVRIGVQPNSELFRSQCDVDEKSYIKTNSESLTSVDGVYAVGDVSNPASPTVSTAAGTAATAVKHFFGSKNTRWINPKI